MSENKNFSSSETKSRRIPDPFRERTSPFDNSQTTTTTTTTTTTGPPNTITIPNKVSESIILEKFSIDRFYPIALEQSQKISVREWLEFCDNVDKVLGPNRWAAIAVGLSWVIVFGLFIYLLVEIVWLQNWEELLVAIGFIVMLPAWIYKCHITGKTEKKLTAFLLEFSDSHSDVEITLLYSNLWLEVTNIEVDWQDVEFESRMENPSSSSNNNNNNSPPKIYYLWNDNRLQIDSKYLRWRKIQMIRNRNASRGASRCS